MDSMVVHLSVSDMESSDVLHVVLEAEDSPHGLLDARWVAFAMASGMGLMVDAVVVDHVEL